MYEAEADPYCYPGTTVLKNKLELRDQPALDAFETEITAQRASEPLPPGELDYASTIASFSADEAPLVAVITDLIAKE